MISAVPTEVAIALAAQITFSRALRMHTSETVSPVYAHKTQSFVAGVNVAPACIEEEQRAGPIANRTGENRGSVQVMEPSG